MYAPSVTVPESFESDSIYLNLSIPFGESDCLVQKDFSPDVIRLLQSFCLRDSGVVAPSACSQKNISPAIIFHGDNAMYMPYRQQEEVFISNPSYLTQIPNDAYALTSQSPSPQVLQ